MPQTLHILVDGGVLFDVGVRLRNVGFRLVVVVVAHEVLDCVIRKQLFKFVGQLGRECFVRRQHEGRSLHLFNEPRSGCRFTSTCGAQEHDVALPTVDAFGQLFDRCRLVTCRFILRNDLKACIAAFYFAQWSILGIGQLGVFCSEGHAGYSTRPANRSLAWCALAGVAGRLCAQPVARAAPAPHYCR